MTLDSEGLFTDATPSTIRTFTGKRVDPLEAFPRDIDEYDIAHALARQCRYNGHVDHFLSVARHSIWVHDWLAVNYSGERVLQLWGLLHDAGEAYLGDMVKPLKRQPAMQKFVDAETKLDSVIAYRFNLPFPMPAEVHEADRVVTVDYEIGRNWRNASDWQDITRDEDEFLERFDLHWRYLG